MISDRITDCWSDLSESAQKHIRRTRPELLEQWELWEEGYHYDTIEADDATEALAAAESRVDRDNYLDCPGTIWVDVSVRNCVTGEEKSSTVTLDEPEPECLDGQEHDWRSPFSVLGGMQENPGVWGHGGGVIVREVCAHCGAYRKHDSWAQNPENGEQGLDSTEYEPADVDSLAWVARRKLRAWDRSQELTCMRSVEQDDDDGDRWLVTLDYQAPDEDADQETRAAAWSECTEYRHRIENDLPRLPDGVTYSVDLDDEDMTVVIIRVAEV